jgi:hypothetical protein
MEMSLCRVSEKAVPFVNSGVINVYQMFVCDEGITLIF